MARRAIGRHHEVTRSTNLISVTKLATEIDLLTWPNDGLVILADFYRSLLLGRYFRPSLRPDFHRFTENWAEAKKDLRNCAIPNCVEYQFLSGYESMYPVADDVY